MDEKTLLLQYLTKVYNKTEDEIASLIYDGDTIKETAFSDISTLDAAKVERLKKEGQDKFKNGYAKAKEEVAKEFEGKFKEVTGFDADAEDFTDLVSKYNGHISEQMKGKKELTPEAVKMHPEYLRLEKERVPKTEYEKALAEYTQFKESVEREKKFSAVKSRARQILETLKPALPEVPQVRENLINTYLNSLEQYDFADDGNGNMLAVKNGERVTDSHGNPIYLDTLAKNEASNWFTFLKQDPKGSAGNQQHDAGNQQVAGLVITSTKQYQEAMSKLGETETDKKARVELFNAYKTAKEQGKLTD